MPIVLDRVFSELASDITALEADIDGSFDFTNKEAFDVHTRMLYSCLVEADRTDAAGLEWARHTIENPEALLCALLQYIKKRADQVPEGYVKEMRQEILRDCLDAASWDERLLSLTAPTGGGKTLAAMAFALKRACNNTNRGKRIIVVIPFLSIIEQTAKAYGEALGEGYIVEHHCAIDNGEESLEETPEGYRAKARIPEIENWDAPIIVTTSVRFFETLFSNKPSDLRRLHNIANATIILDEVQTLPRHYISALLSMMKRLADNWGSTFLFCTATQPAFEKSAQASQKDKRWPKNTVREIIGRPDRLLKTAKRVDVFWPGQGGVLPQKCSMAQLAAFMKQEDRSLCIVNLKRHALMLYSTLKETCNPDEQALFHLSTRMCPQHRLDTIKAVQERLSLEQGACRLVATQLVEAGVDIDFPVVLRALGPLDAIAQAAGRCDREGKLTEATGKAAGRMYVFELEEDNVLPSGAYTDATKITHMLGPMDIYDPNHLRQFFNVYYDHDLDQRDIQALRSKLNFREVAENFIMIDTRTTSVLTPYNQEAVQLIRQLEMQKIMTRELARKLQRYQVGLYPQEKIRAYNNGAIYELFPDSSIFACEDRFYASDSGFHIDSDEPLIG